MFAFCDVLAWKLLETMIARILQLFIVFSPVIISFPNLYVDGTFKWIHLENENAL